MFVQYNKLVDEHFMYGSSHATNLTGDSFYDNSITDKFPI